MGAEELEAIVTKAKEAFDRMPKVLKIMELDQGASAADHYGIVVDLQDHQEESIHLILV